MPVPVALITGVGRRRSIGTALALGLAADGWNVALNHWTPYDERSGHAGTAAEPAEVAAECRGLGVEAIVLPADLTEPSVPADLVAATAERLGPPNALVMAHCEGVESSVLDTTVESWDRHFAVNARASWLLIKAFAAQLPPRPEPATVQGRIVALTSDHTAHNLPYGASKGALDRLVIAAAAELAHLGVRANVINPGPVDTGWMSDEIRASALAETPAGRGGRAEDTADLVRFLLSDRGTWINGQLLYSNGGFRAG